MWIMLFLNLGGCGSFKSSFKNVEKGKIPLASAEIEAVRVLLTEAGIPPKKFPVFVEKL